LSNSSRASASQNFQNVETGSMVLKKQKTLPKMENSDLDYIDLKLSAPEVKNPLTKILIS